MLRRLLVLVAVITSGCAKKPVVEPAKVEPAKEINIATDPIAKIGAPDLVRQYADNAAKADGLYLGKWIEVRVNGQVKKESAGYQFQAKVMTMAPQSMGAIQRMSEQEKDWYNNGVPPSLLATFKNTDGLDKVTPAKAYIIRGYCRGSKADEKVPFKTIVLMDGCELVGEAK